VSVLIVVVALVILGGIVVVAMGRGGELARESEDQPVTADFESGADVARYRPPPALLGYHAGATEYALLLVGRALADRDAEIAWLRGRLRELQPEGERHDGALIGPPEEGAQPDEEAGPVAPDQPADSVTGTAGTGRGGDQA
jgi:hypothetical protein